MRYKEMSWQISWPVWMAFCKLHWSFIDAGFNFAICKCRSLVGSQSFTFWEWIGQCAWIVSPVIGVLFFFPRRLIKIRPSLYIHVAVNGLENSLRLKPDWCWEILNEPFYAFQARKFLKTKKTSVCFGQNGSLSLCGPILVSRMLWRLEKTILLAKKKKNLNGKGSWAQHFLWDGQGVGYQ